MLVGSESLNSNGGQIVSMLDVHADAIREVLPIYHEFIAKYKRSTRLIYGFVEGKDDPSFYHGFIDHMLPSEWDVDIYPVGNKDKVIGLYEVFDWERFPKSRILFFVDRDLSAFLAQKLPRKRNMYITDNYSIENDIVNKSTCKRVLREVCNLSALSTDEMGRMLDMFDTELERFRKELIPIMCWIIHWRRRGFKPSFNDIRMNHLFRLDSGRLDILPSPKGAKGYMEYIHSQCSISFDPKADLTAIQSEFIANGGTTKFIRGKYELWFLVKFVLSVHQSIPRLSAVLTVSPPMRVSLGDSNAVILIAPRARMPESLRRFLKKTCVTYINHVNAADG